MNPQVVARWIALLVLAVGAWYLPWVAYGVAGLVLLVFPLVSYRAFKQRQFVALLSNLIAITVTAASLYVDRRGMALIPLLALASTFFPNASRATSKEYDAKMLTLRAKGQKGRIDPTEPMLAAFESKFALDLPRDYRAFVLRHGSTYVEGRVRFLEATPLGTSASVGSFFGFLDDSIPASQRLDLATVTEIAEGRGLTVPIASNQRGDWFFLVCSGKNQGRVLLRDAQQRHLWNDNEFNSRFPNLDASIAEYLKHRRQGVVTKPLSEIAGWYLVGENFTDFLRACRPAAPDEAT